MKSDCEYLDKPRLRKVGKLWRCSKPGCNSAFHMTMEGAYRVFKILSTPI